MSTENLVITREHLPGLLLARTIWENGGPSLYFPPALQDATDAARAAQPAPVVPEGWRCGCPGTEVCDAYYDHNGGRMSCRAMRDDACPGPTMLAAAPAPAQQAGQKPVQVVAVAVTKEDAEGGLYLSWLLEGGICELEHPGVVLLATDGASLTGDNGHGEVYTLPQPSPDVAGPDTARLDFMLRKCRQVMVERLPHDNFEVYVTEGVMGDYQYPSVRYSGEWDSSSPEAMEIKREAIDAALAAHDKQSGSANDGS